MFWALDVWVARRRRHVQRKRACFQTRMVGDGGLVLLWWQGGSTPEMQTCRWRRWAVSPQLDVVRASARSSTRTYHTCRRCGDGASTVVVGSRCGAERSWPNTQTKGASLHVREKHHRPALTRCAQIMLVLASPLGLNGPLYQVFYLQCNQSKEQHSRHSEPPTRLEVNRHGPPLQLSTRTRKIE